MPVERAGCHPGPQGDRPDRRRAPPAFLDHRRRGTEKTLARALGEWLSEPKPQVWFDDGRSLAAGAAVRLDRRTRVLYDEHHVFINGEEIPLVNKQTQLRDQYWK